MNGTTRLVFKEVDYGRARALHWRNFGVFMNPPYGGLKFLDHANGIAIVRAYTSSRWWHEHVVPRAELLLFPKGKTKFIRPDGTVGRSPGHGVVLIGMGEVAHTALRESGLGFCAVIVEPGRVQLPLSLTGRAA